MADPRCASCHHRQSHHAAATGACEAIACTCPNYHQEDEPVPDDPNTGEVAGTQPPWQARRTGYALLREGGEPTPRRQPRSPCRCGHDRTEHGACRCREQSHSPCAAERCACRHYTPATDRPPITATGPELIEHARGRAVALLTEAVLTAHQRNGSSGCLCGQLRLGAQGHAAHVREHLAAEGVLRD